VARPAGTATRELILDAARTGLLDAGYAGLSTRRVAEGAEVPLSQLHYHFGGKQQLILSVLARENERLLERQARMYGEERPLSERYDQACDFLEDDLASGYVRVLQEMIAAGWANSEIAVEVRRMVQAWIDLLTSVADEAEQRGVSLGAFSARELGALLAAAFLGGESMLLLGMDDPAAPVRRSLRRVGELIRQAEARGMS
jgi:AcrR family transcriptional regulator